MRSTRLSGILAACLASIGTAFAADPAPNGIAYPDGWQNWSAVAARYRTDNNTIRVIVGNEIAVALH